MPPKKNKPLTPKGQAQAGRRAPAPKPAVNNASGNRDALASVCASEMRDPMTNVCTFLEPLEHKDFKGTCKFFALCFQHSMYLEVTLNGIFASITTGDKKLWVPTLVAGFKKNSNLIIDVIMSGTGKGLGKESENQPEPEPPREYSEEQISATIEHFAPRVSLNRYQAIQQLQDRGEIPSRSGEEAEKNKKKVSLSVLIVPPSTLRGCENLQTVRLSKLHHLTRIESNSFTECRQLIHISVESCPRLELIETKFGALNPKLFKVRLQDLPALRRLGGGGCYGGSGGCFSTCPKLEDVSLVDLPALEEVEGDYFLATCDKYAFNGTNGSIKKLRVENVPNLTVIGSAWLGGNGLHSVESTPAIDFQDSVFGGLQRVGEGWLRNTSYSSIKGLSNDLEEEEGANGGKVDDEGSEVPVPLTLQQSSFPKLQYVGPDWMYGMQRLLDVVVNNMPHLETVAANWLGRCNQLRSVSVSHLPRLSSIGHGFLNSSDSLSKVHFSHLPELTSVGNWWASYCPSLVSFSLESLPKLAKVGIYWLASCKQLTRASFKDLPSLKSIGSDFLADCLELEEVSFVNCPELDRIDEDFLVTKQGVVGGPKLKTIRAVKVGKGLAIFKKKVASSNVQVVETV